MYSQLIKHHFRICLELLSIKFPIVTSYFEAKVSNVNALYRTSTPASVVTELVASDDNL